MNDKLKEAGFGKRIFSYLIDAAIVVIVAGILYGTVTSNFMFKALKGDVARQDMYSFAADSGLFSMTGESDSYEGMALYDFSASGASSSDDSTTVADDGTPAYEAYFNKIWNYYTVFIPTDSRAVRLSENDTDYTSDQYYTYFDETILGLPDPSKFIKTDDLTADNSTRYGTSTYYQYALNAEGTAIDLTAKPVLQNSYQTKVDAADATTLSALKSYFYASTDSGTSGLYYTACEDLEGLDSSVQTYYSIAYNQYSFILWECLLPAFLPIQLIIFFLIPIFMPNGETLGKKICGLAVVGINGYVATPSQKIGRASIVTLLGCLLALPWSTLGLMAYVILALVDYVVLMLSKTHQSIHDKLSGTICVSAKESVWFASSEDEAAYEEAHSAGNVNPEEAEENARVAREDSVLDLSTMNKNREEAKSLSSFDDFEKKKPSASPSSQKIGPQPKVNLTKVDEETPSPDEETSTPKGKE